MVVQNGRLITFLLYRINIYSKVMNITFYDRFDISVKNKNETVVFCWFRNIRELVT